MEKKEIFRKEWRKGNLTRNEREKGGTEMNREVKKLRMEQKWEIQERIKAGKEI